MDEYLHTDSAAGIQGAIKLPDDNIVLKKSESSKPEVIDQYYKILEDIKQNKSVSGNLGATFICILIFLCVFLNIYLVETQKYELNILKIQQELVAKEKQAELDKIKLQIAQKNKESADMVSFNDKYLLIRSDYYNKIKTISFKAEDKSNSIEDIIKITEERIKLTRDYKSKLNTIAIPDQLANFYKYETDFIDSDITLWGIVIGYYKLDDLSKFDAAKIYEESNKSHELFIKSQEELKNIYTKYGLSYFFKDIIINY
jgi:hypothetical protein